MVQWSVKTTYNFKGPTSIKGKEPLFYRIVSRISKFPGIVITKSWTQRGKQRPGTDRDS